mgnify:CR=1 FL=1
MATDPFKIIEEAFENASVLSGEERATYLETFQKKHPDLVDQLRRLLEADYESDHTFSDPIEASIKATAQDREDHWLGRQLGVWQLSRRLGAGGMGTVFLASRTGDEFQQTAAVKIMGNQLLNANASSRSEEHTSELQSLAYLVSRLLLEKKKKKKNKKIIHSCYDTNTLMIVREQITG